MKVQPAFIFLVSFMCILNSLTINAQRLQETINGFWKFYKSDAPDAFQINFDATNWATVNLPHTWNTEDIHDDDPGYYRGTGWYRKNLSLDSLYINKSVFLYFEAANQVLELFINGQSVGKHVGGYTSFCFDITKYVNIPGKNIIAVKLDNAHHKDIPPLDADFNFYGGIYRDVWLISTDKVHFDLLNFGSNGIFIETPKVTAESAEVNIRGAFVNENKEKVNVRLENIIKDQTGEVIAKTEQNFQVAPGKTEFTQEQILIQTPNLWSPESPYLYTLETRLLDANSNKILDLVKNPLGFRWYHFDAENGFYLNDKPYKLVGTNRHQDLLGQGNALSNEQHDNDMMQLKEMGINFLRISHYPQDPRVLEACDRLGFIASEEIPLINEITVSQAFADNCRHRLREMIRRDYNHPSILIWNLSNELTLRRNVATRGMSNKEIAEYDIQLTFLIKSLDSLARSEDPARYTMTVGHGDLQAYERLGLNSITQLVGYNLYYGWYEPDLQGFEKFCAEFHKLHPDVPLFITEYGAGADPRIRTFEPKRFDFSVEYENLFHEYHIDVILRVPYILGSNVWNFADFYSEFRGDAVPHVNNKGLVGLDRKPKDTYYLYQAILRKDPIVTIASKGWSLRAGTPVKADENFCVQPVIVYSNQPEVELFLNGQSLGKQKVENYKTSFNAPFVNGKNLLEAQSDQVKDVAEIEFQLLPYNLEDPSITFYQIAVNCGSHFYFNDDENKTIWLPDQAYREGSWGYLDGKHYMRSESLLGSARNILNTENDPIFQTQRQELSGYRFDVPDGRYEVTLYFSELQNKQDRTFGVKINEQIILSKFNMIQEYGAFYSISKRFVVDVTDGQYLNITFDKINGEAVLNGIMIRKL